MVHIKVHLIILEYQGKAIFCNLIQKVPYNLDVLDKVIYFKNYLVNNVKLFCDIKWFTYINTEHVLFLSYVDDNVKLFGLTRLQCCLKVCEPLEPFQI